MAYDEFDDEMEQTDRLDPNIRRQLREAEKAKKELEAVRAQLELERREVLFSKAGIPDTGAGALLRKAYDGESSLEAIQAEAEKYGILGQTQAPTPVAQEPSFDAELEAQRRAQGATVGSVGAMPDAEQEYMAAISAATSVEEVMRVVKGELGQRVGVQSSQI